MDVEITSHPFRMNQEEILEEFKLFLQTAPVDFKPNETIKRFQLPNGEFINCVLWNELFHITGTDIVKVIQFRFECLGKNCITRPYYFNAKEV